MSRNNAPWMIGRKLLTKTKDKTDPDFGVEPKKRPYPDLVRFGIVNLDKPSGPSSHEVASWLKRILKVNRTGHGGTLEVSKK